MFAVQERTSIDNKQKTFEDPRKLRELVAITLVPSILGETMSESNTTQKTDVRKTETLLKIADREISPHDFSDIQAAAAAHEVSRNTTPIDASKLFQKDSEVTVQARAVNVGATFRNDIYNQMIEAVKTQNKENSVALAVSYLKLLSDKADLSNSDLTAGRNAKKVIMSNGQKGVWEKFIQENNQNAGFSALLAKMESISPSESQYLPSELSQTRVEGLVNASNIRYLTAEATTPIERLKYAQRFGMSLEDLDKQIELYMKKVGRGQKQEVTQ